MQTFRRHCAISSTLSPKFRYSSNGVRFGWPETNPRRVMRFLLLKAARGFFHYRRGGLKITSMWVVLHDRVDEEEKKKNQNQNCAAVTTCATGNTRGDVRSRAVSIALAPMWKQFTHGEDVGRYPGDGASEASLTVAQVFTVWRQLGVRMTARGVDRCCGSRLVGWLAGWQLPGAQEDCVTLSLSLTCARERPPTTKEMGSGRGVEFAVGLHSLLNGTYRVYRARLICTSHCVCPLSTLCGTSGDQPPLEEYFILIDISLSLARYTKDF